MPSHKQHPLLLLVLSVALTSGAIGPVTDTANEMFAHTQAKAKQEHKHVLLVFSDAYCPYCKLYENFLEDPQMKQITEKAFVIQRIDLDQTPGAGKLRIALAPEDKLGIIPFYVMTDDNGHPIVDSNRNGNPAANIGYPALPVEIDWYIKMLRRAAPELSAKDLATTRAWLQAHAPHLSTSGQ